MIIPLLLLLGAWFLVGALPRMRADAADKLPAIRQGARTRMSAHSEAARKAGRRKSAEWYGWAGAAAGAETVAVLGYMGRSAWHGWGDHRRRAKAAAEAYRQKRANRATADEPAVPPGDPAPVPPDGGNRATPPLPAETVTVPPDGSNLRPFRPRPAGVPAGSPSNNRGDRNMPAGVEAPDLETAVHVADELKAECTREVDEAATELAAAEAAATRADSFGSSLASAGVSGGVVEALASFADGISARVTAAKARVASADSGLAAATKAREDLRKHEAAADSLSATGGAADTTAWYGQAG